MLCRSPEPSIIGTSSRCKSSVIPEVTLTSRYIATLLGLAIGDALGTIVEFSPRGSFQPLITMTGAGPFNLKPDQWTDDSSMALCLVESLITKNAFNPADQMARHLNW